MAPSRAGPLLVRRLLSSSPTTSSLGVGRAAAGTTTTTGLRRMHGAACPVWGQPLQAHARRQRGSVLTKSTLPVCSTRRIIRTFATSGEAAPQPQSDAEPPQPPEYLSPAELAVFEKLKAALEPRELEVQDISGGCGSMYGIKITSAKFRGKSIVMMHRMVNEVLKEELKAWHGVQLKTRASS